MIKLGVNDRKYSISFTEDEVFGTDINEGAALIDRAEPLDAWCSFDGVKDCPSYSAGFRAQKRAYSLYINDGGRLYVPLARRPGCSLRKLSQRSMWRMQSQTGLMSGGSAGKGNCRSSGGGDVSDAPFIS
jgi:hypothetical protein